MYKSLILSLVLIFSAGVIFGQGNSEKIKFTESFNLEKCTFLTSGRNEYFILEPGYQLILEGADGKDKAKLEILVLNETKKIDATETRVITESEWINGQIVEISRNYFAFCKETGSVFYFGEDVDNYKNGKVINHNGSWIAEGKNKPGLAMPGMCLLGARYYQEIAPGEALDKAEIVSLTESLKTPSGEFKNCLKTEETNDLEPDDREYKIYAPGIGLIKDENLMLTKYGFKK